MPDITNRIDDQLMYSNIFNFDTLIKLPIQAVIDANIQAAMASANFIRKFGFVKQEARSSDSGDQYWGELRMATFTYDYAGTGGVPQQMVISIPILSLIPLPLLIVDRAEFEFGIQIINHLVRDKISVSTNGEETIARKKEVFAMLTPLNDRRSTPAEEVLDRQLVSNMNARVEIVQSDLPAGILQLINLSQEATRGNTTYDFALNIAPQRLEFDNELQTLELKVIVQAAEQDPSESLQVATNQVVQINISSETSAPDNLFKPIKIIKGGPVGIPEEGTASAISGASGEVVFELTAVKNAVGNGFIRILTKLAEAQEIYFNLSN